MLNSNKSLKIKISLTLDENIVERIKELSEDSFRSFSQYVNLVLAEHIKEIDAKENTKK